MIFVSRAKPCKSKNAMKFKGLFLLFLIAALPCAYSQQPPFIKQDIFPFQEEHVHGATIVELPGGELLAGWFQGSGERWADDVRIMGARKKKGSDAWSKPFILADVKEFPDINPVLFLDGRDRLWLMWYTVIANQWETSLIKYRISGNYSGMDGAPEWDWQADLHVKPGDKSERGIQPGDSFVESVKRQVSQYGQYLAVSGMDSSAREWEKYGEFLLNQAGGKDMLRKGRVYKEDGSYTSQDMGYPYFRRMGWQTRNKPYITSSGRMIVPLYSDGFSFSLMAFTDDWGESWDFSEPLVGGGNIQPAIAVTKSGTLVAYMRDNGPPPQRLQISRSADKGKTWSPVKDTELLNPGSAADVITLRNGNWVLIYNDLEDGRHKLLVALSEDEGETWPWSRRIEDDQAPVKAHYPAIIEGADGVLHATYSYFLPDSSQPGQKAIRYVSFTESWIRAGSTRSPVNKRE